MESTKRSQIDLNLLNALDALLAERSVSRAGNRLSITQPAMSRALSRLRRIFNDPLLVRVGNENHLTDLAAELEGPLREILQRIEETIDRRLDFDPLTDHRTFRVAASDYAAYVILRPLVRHWRKNAPFVTLRITPVTGRHTIEQIEAGDIDLGIWSDRVRSPHLEHQYLLSDRVVIAASKDLPEEELSHESFSARPQIKNYRNPHDMLGLVDPPIYNPVDSRDAPLWLEEPLLRLLYLEETEFVTISYERLVREVARSAGIKAIEPTFPTEPLMEAMFWHARKNLDPAHSWLRKQMADISGSL